jgi:hypothetical protein
VLLVVLRCQAYLQQLILTPTRALCLVAISELMLRILAAPGPA